MKKLHIGCGVSIYSAAAQMVEACKDNEQVSIEFNGVTVVADKTSTTESIVADYNAQSEADAERYRNSPAGKRAAEEARQEVERLQTLYDESLAELPSLNFDDQAGLLAWFEKIQPATDHIGVEGRIEGGTRILEAFVEHGYLPNVNTGDASNPDDPDNAARYIIGQCLTCLGKDGFAPGSIHQVVHHFIAEWRKKFQPKAA
ncbi:MAG: hypothetical protein Q8O19_06550 [Rectinemataceae bacterium]|nr:hypothetical protein [Rectinemataceae bacterium]